MKHPTAQVTRMDELPIEADVHTAKTLLDSSSDILLLDCRQAEEHELVSIEGDRHIPMDQLPQRVGELADSRDSPILVYCHLGVRSLMVSEWLRANGFSKAQSMRGGIDAWAVEIEPSMRRYG